MAEDRRERNRESDHHTTVVTTDGGGGGAGTVLAVVLGIILVGIAVLLIFGGWLGGAAEEIDVPERVGIEINVNDPALRSPEIEVPEPATPPANESGNGS